MRAITRVRLRIHLKALPQYVLVLANLIITAWVCDKWIEAASYAVSFLYFRYRFTDIFHCKTTFRCILATNVLVFIAVPLTLPLSKTLLGGMLMGVAVNYALNLIASDISRKVEKAELDKLRREKRTREITMMDEESIRRICRENMLDEYDAEIIIQILIHRLRGERLYSKIGFCKAAIMERKKKIKTKLNIYLK